MQFVVVADSMSPDDVYHTRHDEGRSSGAEDEDLGVPTANGLRGPYFETSASKNVTALVGKTAYLNCRVRNLGNKTVSPAPSVVILYVFVSHFSVVVNAYFLSALV